MMKNMDWYNSLTKPFLSPPAEVFAPVWSVLYVMILASFLVFLKGGNIGEKLVPLGLFILQLILNLIWSEVFFGLKNITVALWILVALVVLLLATIVTFYQHSKVAAWLLVPYFVWCLFALYLNFGFWRLNS